MASITFGFGVSHGPLLVTPPDKWSLRADWDRAQPAHHFRGQTYSFDELIELRRDEELATEIDPATMAQRHARCGHRIDELGGLLREAEPDIVLVAGDDQREWIMADLQPAFTIFHGASVTNLAFDPERASAEPSIAYRMQATEAAGEDQTYPVASDLARHVIERLVAEGFDPAASARQPAGPDALRQLGHAWGFVCRQLLHDAPPPLVPVLVNTFYAPNRPSPARCYELGRAIGRAIRSWPAGRNVAIGGSGGMSHFVIDEQLDHAVLEAIAAGDVEAISGFDDGWFRSGTSEIKNWLVAAGALADSGLEMELLDYVPCYRSMAGTGCAMAFAVWR